MFTRMFTTMAKQSAKHLRGYNPFVEFKSDINRTLDKHIHMSNTILDKHIQMNNTIMMAGFGALGGGMAMLYQKTEVDKKDLNHKIDTNTADLDKRIDYLDKRIDHLDQRMDHLDQRMDHIEKRMEHIDQKLGEVLALMTAPKKWF